MEWLLVYIGVFGGFIGAMGMGGGTLLIPLLTSMTPFQQMQAQGLNLVAFLPMSVVSLFLHKKNNLLDYYYAPFIAISAIVCAVVGSKLTFDFDELFLRKCFGVFLILLASFGIFQTILQAYQKKTKK